MYEKKILLGFPIIISMILMLFVSCSSTKGSMGDKEGIEKKKLGAVVDSTDDTKYVFPFEDEEHEGTWLQWPHDYTYGEGFKDELDPIWIEMTRGLTRGENVHIIVYNKKEIETYIKKYYGVINFIWLDGVVGQDITDFHIDGFAKFYDDSTIITMNEEDLSIEWGVSEKDINTLLEAKNLNGNSYEYIYLPLSKNNVILESGKKLGYKGSYVNFYIGNDVVLVPNYNDANDEKANAILQELYPNRKIVGIDVRELYQYGGMIHCVTQQQPINKK